MPVYTSYIIKTRKDTLALQLRNLIQRLAIDAQALSRQCRKSCYLHNRACTTTFLHRELYTEISLTYIGNRRIYPVGIAVVLAVP